MHKKREKLIDEFIKINSKINLSSIRDKNDIYTKHILDSLELKNVLDINIGYKNIIDLGTGSGFPLLPLAIDNGEINFVGIDSTKKKVDAINKIIETMGIKNCKILWGRIENHVGYKYDVVIARAVAYIDILIERSYHLLNKGGIFIFYKIDSKEERNVLIQICKKKNITIDKQHKYKLFDGDISRCIYILKKNND